MTDAYVYDMATDIAIIAGFIVLGLTILLVVWLAETRKRRTPGNRHGSNGSRFDHS